MSEPFDIRKHLEAARAKALEARRLTKTEKEAKSREDVTAELVFAATHAHEYLAVKAEELKQRYAERIGQALTERLQFERSAGIGPMDPEEHAAFVERCKAAADLGHARAIERKNPATKPKEGV